ncbi:MAG: proprotein convertase P-domain-containing protein [Saprospiraceae bacterium]
MLILRQIILLLFFGLPLIAFGQSYSMNDPQITDCNGIFFDAGGPGVNYPDDAVLTTTICANGSSGTHIRVTFNKFALAQGDSLFFYDATTADPGALLGNINSFGSSESQLIEGNNFTVQATAANPSGCLTLVFQPNNDGNVASGWEAILACGVACQNIFVDLAASDPVVMPADTGFIDVCPGEIFSLSAAGTYPQSGIVYTQSDQQTTFDWVMDDGNVAQGQDITYSYDEPGGYVVQIIATDQQGCKNLNYATQRIRVAPPPIFNTDVQYPICNGDTISLTASNMPADDPDVLVEPGTSGFPIGGIRADSLPLPDGFDSYKTTISIKDFPENKLLERPEDLESICLNIEHSYLFDLDIILTCPNGQSDTLQATSFISGQISTLGDPYEADDGQNTGLNGHIPGVGFDYCFTADADYNWNEYIAANGPGQLPAGDYLPIQSFDNFVGCPLNGEWTLEVADRLADDNGWIFEWSIDFAKRILPFSKSFSPAIIDYSWVNNPEIDFYSQDSIATFGSSAGDVTYVLNATDEFGCSWDTSVVVTVLPLTHPDCYSCGDLLRETNDVLICNPEARQLDVTNNELVLQQPVNYIATPYLPVGFDNAPPGMPLESVISVGNVVPAVITDPANQIISICIDMETDAVGDIDLLLRAPSGQVLELTTGNGGNASDFNQVCFSPTAATPIDLAFPPYSGAYLPEGDFNDLIGASIDGDWTLIVSDDNNINQEGLLKSWSITFQSTNEITYSWSPAIGLDCDDCPNPNATPFATTNYVVTARDLFGCQDRDTIIVAIASDLPEPTITCETTSNGEISFFWEKVENFSLFDIRFTRNGVTGAWQGPVTDLSFVVPGLQLLDTVSLDLRVFADPNAPSCDNPEVRATCVYSACVHEGQIEEVLPVSCSDVSDGSISIMGINGAAPYLYFLDGSSTSQDTGYFAGLSAGDHMVIIQDRTGCQDTTIFEVPAPLPLTATIEREKAVSCHDGNDGILRAMIGGGSPPYRYEWISVNRPDTNIVGELPPGTYEVLVTDANGCMIASEFTLINPQEMVVSLSATPTSCADVQDGNIMTSVSGGTPNYSYLWDTGATVADPSNLAPGEHCVTVTDARGCSQVSCITILSPDPLQIDEVLLTPATCFDTNTGKANVIASGGTGEYSYLWNDNLQQISQEAVRLRAGNYTIVVTDVNDCQVSTSVTITQPEPLVVTPVPVDARCFESADGTATVNMTGGTAPFSYIWSNGDTIATASGMSTGNYDVSVTDSNGCTATSAFFIGQPDSPVTVTTLQTDRGCAGMMANAVEATANGGTGNNYTFSWNDPAQQSGPTASGLDSLAYIVTAMDSNGCTGQDSIKIQDLPAIKIGIIANSPSCADTEDGRMGINQVSGGVGGDNTSNYSFLWNTGATTLTLNNLAGDREYAVTATESRGCQGVQTRFLPLPDTISFDYIVMPVSCNEGGDGSITIINIMGEGSRYSVSWGPATGSQTGETASGLRAGSYRVTVSDDRGCSNANSIVVEEPAPISLQFGTTDISCYGGNEGVINVKASGGLPDYMYSWSNGVATGTMINNLSAGTYSVTVTDANSCTTVGSATVRQPATVEVNLTVTDVSCFGDTDGRIEISTQGGTPPYQYSSNNLDYNGISTIIGLSAGPRSVYVRDAKGCLYVEPVIVETPPLFSIDLGPDLTINLGDTVTLSANLIDPAGGIADLFWSAPYAGTMSCEQCENPSVFPQNTIYYDAVAYDANGCEAEDQVRVIVEKPRSVLVPTGFTPNGDGKNDQLLVHGLEGTQINIFRIFDRWGQLIYERKDFPVNDPDFGWDGTFRGERLNSGVYIWYLEAVYPFDQRVEQFKGQTTLIR